jgi:hypothetical protein
MLSPRRGNAVNPSGNVRSGDSDAPSQLALVQAGGSGCPPDSFCEIHSTSVPNSEQASNEEVPSFVTDEYDTDAAMSKSPRRLVITPEWAEQALAKLDALGQTEPWLAAEITKRYRRKTERNAVWRALHGGTYSSWVVGPICTILDIAPPAPQPDGASSASKASEPTEARSGGPQSQSPDRDLEAAILGIQTIRELDEKEFREIAAEIVGRALHLSQQERKKR